MEVEKNNREDSQEKINKIWGKVWQETDPHSIKKIFNNRLFIEGYPVFKKYIPAGGGVILDIGAGSGRYGLKLASDFPEKKLLITDITYESLTCINSLAAKLEVTNIEVKKENVLKLSLPDNSVDVVFCDVVIQHIPDYKLAVKEMARVLKSSGRLIMANNNFWNFHTLYKWLVKILKKNYTYDFEKSFSKAEMRQLLIDNKLVVLAEDGFYPAYGIYRLKNVYPKFGWLFSFLGKIINRITKFLDKFTCRFFSRFFGIELVIVGQK